MIITLTRRTVICLSVEVQLTGMVPLGAVSHNLSLLLLLLLLLLLSLWEL